MLLIEIIIASILLLIFIIGLIFVVKNSKSYDNEEIISPIMLKVPSSALNECYRQADNMLLCAKDTVIGALKLVVDFNLKATKNIVMKKHEVDNFEEKLSNYLMKIQGNTLNENDNLRKLRLDLTVGNFQFLSDYAMKIVKLAENMNNNNIKLFDEKSEQFTSLTEAFEKMFDLLYEAYNNSNYDTVLEIADIKNAVLSQLSEMKVDDSKMLRASMLSTNEYYILSSIYSDCEYILDNILYICENSVNTAIRRAV